MTRAIDIQTAASSLLLAGALLFAPWAAEPVGAQNGEPERVRIFLDCQSRDCFRNQEEFRTEMTFVDWVRERTVADLHVILTDQDTGGGREFVFDFIGRDDFEGQDLRLTANVSNTDTQDEVVAELVQTFKGGLVPYVAVRGYLDELEIRAVQEAVDAAEQEFETPVTDPWNLWVFSVSANLEADGEERQGGYELGGRLSASRTTPEWKIRVGLDGSHEYQRFELSDRTEEFDNDEWEGDALVVRSLSPHWSAGGTFEINTSTSLNRDVGGRVAAALEWNYFPYQQANRRQFILHYQVGFSRVDYEEETIFGKTIENLYDHRLVAVFDTRQPWGNVSFSAEASNLLSDFDKYRLAGRARTNFRIFRGFDLEIQGNYERIRDQVYLSASGSSDDEVLIRRRELATGYEYSVEVGFSYRFGSIYNNVVNNRFPWSVLN